VDDNMTAEALAERVLRAEHTLLISALQGILNPNE